MRKEINLHGITYLQPLSVGTSEWYYGMDYTSGDLYEAEEIYEEKGKVRGNRLCLVHYPDGTIYEPMPARENLAIGEPVYVRGEDRIAFPAVDFAEGTITIWEVRCEALPAAGHEPAGEQEAAQSPAPVVPQTEDGSRSEASWKHLHKLAELPLSSIDNCYNLRLHVWPLTLSRQPNDGVFELVWPERRSIAVDERESFFYREGDRLYFNRWYEDPDYREETLIRSAATGEVLEQLPGDIQIMPGGELWHLY